MLGTRMEFRDMLPNKSIKLALPALIALTSAAACTPTVKIVAPDKPIEINLNVTITQEVRIILDQEVEDLIADNPDLF